MGKNKNKKKGVNARAGDKKNNYPSQPLDWAASEKKESTWAFDTGLKLGGVFLVAFMAYLFFFVDDPQVTRQKAKAAEMAKKQAEKMAAPPAAFKFELTKTADLAQFNEILQDEDNELVVAVFDSTEKAAAPGLWKRWERLRKGMTKRGPFQKYDEEGLPTIVRFDCNGEGKTFCSKVLGEEGTKKPQAVIFRQKQRPKQFPAEVRSDKKINQYLWELMQPAVKFFGKDNTAEFHNFVDPEDQTPRVMLFADDKVDREGPYAKAADSLRDFAKFGMTEDDDLTTEFGGMGGGGEDGDEEADEREGDVVKMYRKFDEKEVTFEGDATDAAALTKWVKDNSLPTLGEFSPQGQLRQRIQLRELPIVWIHVDRLEDGHDKILEEAKTVARKYKGTYTFTFVDSMTNAQFAKDLGATQAPQVMILSQEQEIRVDIEADNVGTSIERAIDDYKKKTGGGGGAAGGGAGEVDDDDDDDDEDYDEDEPDADAAKDGKIDDKADQAAAPTESAADKKADAADDDDDDYDDDDESTKKDL